MAASTASHYPNSERSASQKWPRDLAPFFRASDLPDHLRETVIVMLQRDRYGTQLWMSKVRLAIELGICRRTAQRRVRRLIELKVLKEISPANSYFRNDPEKFRSSATYEANPEAVKPRPTWKDFEGMRPTHRRVKVKSASQHHRRLPSHHAPTVLPISSPAASEPAPSDVKNESAVRHLEAMRGGQPHRSSAHGSAHPGSRAERTVRQLRQDLVERMIALIRGSPQRPGLTQENALTACCMYFGITAEEATEHLKLVRFEPPQPAPTPAPAPKSEINRTLIVPSPWEKVLALLETRINRHSFDTWLRPTRYAGQANGVLYVRIPTAAFRHVGTKYADLIQEAVEQLGLNYSDIQFEEAEPEASP